MQLSKRDGSPFWWASFTDANGKRHRVSTKCKDKREASKAAGVIEAQADADAPKGDSVTLAGILESYRGYLELHGKVSAKGVGATIKKTLGQLPSSAGRFSLDGNMKAHELTPSDLDALIKARVREGNGPVTIAHELKTLRASVAYAKGLLQRVPTIINWRIPKLTQKTRYLTQEEWTQLFERLSPDRVVSQAPSNRKAFEYTLSPYHQAQIQSAQDLLVCLTYCGGRWSEVANLSFDKIDLEADTIMVWGNKTQKFRMAPLPALLKAVVERRLQVRKPGQNLLFPGVQKDGKESVRNQSSRAITRAIKDCGFNSAELVRQMGRCTVHSLRHTFASWVLQGGGSLADLQKALGHATIHQTLRYAHLSEAATTAKLTGILSAL